MEPAETEGTDGVLDGALQTGEVLQVIMQEDGQIIMPEGQFLQLNTEDGQMQYIQLAGEDGGNQLIQLTPDGQAQILQVADGSTNVIQLASMTSQDQSEDPSEELQMVQPQVVHLSAESGGGESSKMVQLPVSGAGEVFQYAMTDVSDKTLESGSQVLHDGIQVISFTQDVPKEEEELAGEEADAAHTDTTSHMVSIQSQGQLIPTSSSVFMSTTAGELLSQDTGNQTHAGVVLLDSQSTVTQSISPQITLDKPSMAAPKITLSSSSTASCSTAPQITLDTGGTTPGSTEMHLTLDEHRDDLKESEAGEDALKQDDSKDTEEDTASAVEKSTPSETDAKPPKPIVKVIDMNSPISLTSETVVVVDGKKCVLRVDPDSSSLVAYPYKTEGGRKRGRPPKIKKEGVDASAADTKKDASKSGPRPGTSQRGLSEQENSAAEGLLGLSDADGVRRSNRSRKRSRFMSEYELGKIEGVEEEDEDAGEREEEQESPPMKRGRGRPPKNPAVITPTKNTLQTLLANMGYPVKRGRGRPRRSPLPNSGTGPIPAFIIPSPGGQAVMMAPVQNMQQLSDMQKPRAPRPLAIRPKPPEMSTSTLISNPPIIIQNADGSLTQIDPQNLTPVTHSLDPNILQSDPAPQEMAVSGEEVAEGDAEQVTVAQETMTEEDLSVVAEEVPVPEDADDGCAEEDTPVDISEMKDDVPDTAAIQKSLELTDGPKVTTVTITEPDGEDGSTPAAIMQLPPSLVPLLVPKQEPIKIGLKATEEELEKIKCPRCDFQAYYPQQYQEHIATHNEDLLKCKCCPFLTFEKPDLVKHFKEKHPRCICVECEFMSEHAYGIKRHMMRHSTGCECEICGKKYKDQYILKMHIKMVHMPADVLYGCDICSKKFTRKAHLKRHLRIHEPEKPFKCPHCDYRGCERSDITKHLLIHEDPKHVCEVCGKAFRHVKNKELHVKRHKGQRDYKCGVCDFYGYTFTDIRKHIERKHSDAKNILCDKCGSAFKSDTLLREHQFNQCELILIEQALADGSNMVRIPSGHIEIPSGQLGIDGSILIDGNQVNITVEQVDLPAANDTAPKGEVVSAAKMVAPAEVSQYTWDEQHKGRKGSKPRSEGLQ